MFVCERNVLYVSSFESGGNFKQQQQSESHSKTLLKWKQKKYYFFKKYFRMILSFMSPVSPHVLYSNLRSYDMNMRKV